LNNEDLWNSVFLFSCACCLLEEAIITENFPFQFLPPGNLMLKIKAKKIK
jgi:hypothetical protein